MGTNYYVASNHCECCDRYDEVGNYVRKHFRVE